MMMCPPMRFGMPDPDYVGHQLGLPPTFTPPGTTPPPPPSTTAAAAAAAAAASCFPGAFEDDDGDENGEGFGGSAFMGLGGRLGGPMIPMMMPGGRPPMPRMPPMPMQQRMNVIDEHILVKHRAILPPEEDLSLIMGKGFCVTLSRFIG